MPKKSKLVPERAPSKLQISKWERQRKLQRLTTLVGILIIAGVLGVLAFGYYDYRIKPAMAEKADLAQTAFTVNDKAFSRDYLIKMMLLFTARQTGSPPDVSLLDNVVTYIQNLEIVAQEAQKQGITVTPEEIDKEMKGDSALSAEDFSKTYQSILKDFGFTDAEYRDWVKVQLLRTKFQEQVINPQVPKEEMQVQLERILLRIQDDANNVARQLNDGAAYAAVKDLNLDPATKEKDGNTGWITHDALTKAVDDVAFKLKKGEVTEPFFDNETFVRGGYWVLKVTAKDADKATIQAVLLRTEAEAKDVKSRLENREDLATIARAQSLDISTSDKGGDLGEIAKGIYPPEFDQVAFSLEPGQIGGPVYDANRSIKGGYWVLRDLEEPQMQPLDQATLQGRQAEFFQKWLDEKKASYRLENNLDPNQKNSMVSKATLKLMQLTQSSKKR